ncbi:GNAT family N-acetyltransferase [Carnobacterium divergens]|uniref:GNAT family N-acetyltransferase n=2 Tax=Carnobacterium divergens TaxID=2748 RepID=UPI001072B1C6|nr:GNAT family N-acetyltransferase [Carnobacterium divergens]MDT1995273.1 GNAT family N-acetyltransferase [Carnobacterium divergens]TFI68871.1 GNAT family N-acetyltransferase [Carnobacterium divergens]TFI81343.1 GNAT family N-acetyltransferase [Carnobacterium divergens]TFI88835.1 GNAT family N-acetyltransferase [Carnobacterium divergens]TFI90207.1 GNAT family N-acetyltransferase [Carnobacterium divergens]
MDYRKATKEDYPLILKIWEQSVIATHPFLSIKDREAIKLEIPNYFPHLAIQIWFVNHAVVGFSALQEDYLEMLFLDGHSIGKGYGKQILNQLIKDFSIKKVDVNEQNHNAKKFYLKNGFIQVGRDAVDSEGRAYPVLHLKLA